MVELPSHRCVTCPTKTPWICVRAGSVVSASQTRVLTAPAVLISSMCISRYAHLQISLHVLVLLLFVVSPIYCHGDLLHVVQTAQLEDDDKTFVDMRMKNSEGIAINA